MFDFAAEANKTISARLTRQSGMVLLEEKSCSNRSKVADNLGVIDSTDTLMVLLSDSEDCPIRKCQGVASSSL